VNPPPSLPEVAAPRSLAARPVAYLVPEFPGQTDIWIWREISHLRDWGAKIRLFSTRPPDEDAAARHAFAAAARAETTYLRPRRLAAVLPAFAWAALTRPRGLARAVTCALTLDDCSWRGRAAAVSLVVPASALAREARSHDVRHLHVHSLARSAVIAMMVRRLVGIPYSLTLNANLEWWGGGMRSKLADAEFVIVIAEWLRNQVLADHRELDPGRVRLGRVGVDTQRWLPAKPAPATRRFRVVSVARLHNAKGHDILIAALARLRASGRDVELVIIGSGPERAALESLARSLDVSQWIELTGSLAEDEIIERLRAAHAFVLASRFEPLGVVYMEAMALGLPAVGTAAGGVGEIITHDHDGLLVPPEDEERLAAAVARLMDDLELRHRLGRNARETIVERFDSRIGAAVLHESLFGTETPGAVVRSGGG
jgi:colanic acid/amylovoran biosynthesis glycosyltransferase